MVLLDYSALLFSILLSHVIFEFKQFGFFPNESLNLWILFLSFLLIVQFIIFYVGDLYQIPRRNKEVFKSKALSLSICIILLFVFIAVFCYWTKFALGRDVLLLAALISFISNLLTRFALIQVFSPRYLALVKPIRCAFLGNGPLAQQLLQENSFKRNHENYGFISLAEGQNLIQYLLDNSIESVIIDSTDEVKLTDEQINELIKVKFQGIQVIEAGSFYERITSRVPLLHLPGSWFLNSQIFNEVKDQAVIRGKRIFDIMLSALLLLLSSPLILLTCLLIKLTSKGPAIYKQTRVGFNGQIFTLYKLRSMVCDSEKDGAQWTQENDPRVTGLGRFLRASRIDELPQLWNILKGDMSLIGPRPERPEFTENLKQEIPYYDLRHSVRPGLSGWAQVNEPLATPIDSLQKLEFDLFYIRNLSFWLELAIILKTIRVVVTGKGH